MGANHFIKWNMWIDWVVGVSTALFQKTDLVMSV